jgi:protein-S-isoprenylcysteine O-methyltransferase Ste14
MDPRLRAFAIRQVAFLAVSVGLMFLLAGRLDWLGGWLMTALLVSAQVGQWLLVGRRYPDLLVERSRVVERSRAGVKADRGDIPLAMGMAYGPLVAMLAAGLEVRLEGVPGVAPIVPLAGFVIAGVGVVISMAAMLANRFFAPVVRIQDDRGHEVVDKGPYAIVRHPGYVGMLIFYLGLPVMFASWWVALVMAPTVAIAIVRTTREDDYLRANLEGYAGYAERVRWRLVPRVW